MYNRKNNLMGAGISSSSIRFSVVIFAAMFMLVFFTGTSHAAVTFSATPGFTLSPSSATMYPASGQSTTFTASGIESGYSITNWEITATQGIDSGGGVTGLCSTQSGNNAGVNTLTLTYGESFTCTGTEGTYSLLITPQSGPFTIQVTACSTANGCICTNGGTSCTIEYSSVSTLSFASPLSTPGLTLLPTSINSGQTSSEATITWTGGISPYTAGLTYGSSSTSCSSDTTVYPNVQTTGNSAVATISLPAGIYYFCAAVTSNGNPAVTVLSSPVQFISYNPISLTTPVLSQTAIDAGQSVTVSTTASGGSGSYSTANLYESTSSSGTFSLVGSCTLGGTDNSNIACTTTMPSSGAYYFKIQVLDTNTNSWESGSSGALTVNSAPTVSITSPATTQTINGPITVSASASGGTGTLKYSWSVASGTACPGFTSATASSFTYTPTGTTTKCEFTVTVTDSAATPETATATTPQITIPALSITSFTANRPVIDAGQSETLSASISGGIAQYTYSISGCGVSYAPSATSSQTLSTTQNVTCTSGTTTDVQLTVKDSATPAETQTGTAAITAYATPSATKPVPSNTLLDSGQYVTYTTTVSGGKGPFTVNLVGPSGEVIETLTNQNDGTVTFPSFVAPIGTDSYYVSITDTGTTTHYVANSASNTIIVNTTVQKPQISTENSPLDLGQYGYITCSNCDVSGLKGQPGYTYQWMVGFGSNAPNATAGDALCGTTATTTKCDFNTANLNLKSGTYDVVLQVTDSASTPVTNVSSVQEMVVNPALQAPTVAPASQTTTEGGVISISATPNGGTGSEYSFIWLINGVPISCTNTELHVTCTSPDGADIQNSSITFNANYTMVTNSPDSITAVVIDGSKGLPYNTTSRYTLFCSLSNPHPSWFPFVYYECSQTKGNANDSSVSIIVHPSVVANAIVPHDQNPLYIDNGQHIALTETPSGGSELYTFEWFLNDPSQIGSGLLAKNNTGETSNTIIFYGNTSTAESSIGSANDLIVACINDYLVSGVSCIDTPNSQIHVFPVLGTPTISNTTVPSATSLTMDVDQHVRLNASETGGTGNYMYTWYDNGAPISSCNSGSVNTYCLFAPSSTQASSSGKVNDITVQATDIGTDKNATPVQQQTSANFAITAFPALGTPTISPVPVTMDQGQHISLTASETGGTGSSNYQYTWYDGASQISGCTTATCTYTTTLSTTTGAHEITVNVKDTGTTTPPAEPPANATSAQDTITVDTPPQVSASATNTTMDIGQISTITATATGGTGSFSYSWTNTGTCPGFSNPGSVTTFVYTPTSTTTNCVFTITVTDTGVTSGAIPPATAIASTAALTVNPKPSVSVTPASPVIDNGQSILLTSTVIPGTGPFTYQWYTGTPGGTNAIISSATSSTYSASPTSTTSYFMVVTDTGTTTHYVFNSAADSVTVDQTPTLAVSPSSSTEDQGQSIVLTATPSGGTGSFTYQWYNGSSPTPLQIPGATSSTYTVKGGATGELNYYAIITDTGVTPSATPHPETARSNTASVTVDPLLTASLSPSSSTEDQGQSIVLTATPSGGTGSFTYQWYNDSTGSGVSIPSATSATYTVKAGATGPFAYYAVVTDTGVTPSATPNPETATTGRASVTVATAPTITIDSSNTILDSGQTETYTLKVGNGFGPFTAELYNITGSKQVGSNVVIASPGSSQTVSFSTAMVGTFTYKGIATDLGTTNPYTFSSSSNAIIVNTALVSGAAAFTGWIGNGCTFLPTCINTLSSRTTTVMDQGEGVVATLTAPTTGTSPYTYQWLAKAPGQTSYTAAEANALCGSSAQSLSCDFLATTSNPVGSYSFEAQTTDSASSNSVVVSSPVTLTLNAALVLNPITSNALVVDEGQSFALSDLLPATGGTPNFNIIWNINHQTIASGTCGSIGVPNSYNSVCAISTPGSVSLASGSPVSLVPGTYSFFNNVGDSSFQPKATSYDWYNSPLSITINPALTESVTPSASSMHADQQVMLTNTTTGGTKPYSYQWFYEAPGASSYTKINGATSNDFTFDAGTISITEGGTYNFKLQVTDSASNPFTENSSAVPITVNAMFATPKALLNVNANVINDEDSGFNGYWGLDNFTRHITANQIGLQTFVINFTDSGHTFVPAGAKSPNAGTIQPYNGVTTMQGAQNYTFNATSFVTNNLAVATNGMFIGTLNEHGTAADIVGNIAPTGPSSEMYYIDGYFLNAINPMNVGSPNWGGYVYKYNYNIYPPQGQEWIDAGNVPQANSGDIVTYQVPSVGQPSPSNVLLDSGQYETYTATVYNGIGPFTVSLYKVGSSSNTLVGTETTTGTSLSNNPATVTFTAFQPSAGADQYYAVATDAGAAGYTVTSSANTIIVAAAPSLAISPSNSVLDNGEYETYTLAVNNGGIGPFSVELYNVTGSRPEGSNVTIFIPGESNTVTFPANSLANGRLFTYSGMATDLGTTTHYKFSSAQNTITVNTNMSKPTIKSGAKYYDLGQTVDLSSSVPTGGTPPYTYTFTVTNLNTSQTSFECNNISADSCSFTVSYPGLYTGEVTVSDSASTPGVSRPVMPANFIVSPEFYPISTASVFPGSVTVSPGNSVLLTANIFGPGGTSPYTYTFSVYNALNNSVVNTITSVNALESDSVEYAPASNGIYYAKVLINDNASSSEYIQSPASSPFLVGAAGHPIVALTATSPVLDSGQTELFKVSVFGGVGPFNVELYNITGSKPVGSVLIASPDGSNTISMVVSTSTSVNLSYNAIATDTTTGTIFNSSAVSVTVNPPFSDGISLNATKLDIGQNVLITEDVSGGTPTYHYNYYVYSGNTNSVVKESLTENSMNTANSFAYSPSAYGAFSTNVIVYDSSSIPVMTNSLTLGFAVYNAPSITIAPSVSQLNSGQSETFTATVYNGIGPFEIELYNATGNSAVGNFMISTPGASNTITFTATTAANATLLFKAIATDQGTSNPYTFDSATSPVTVNAIPSTTTSGGGNSGSGGGGGGGGGGSSGSTGVSSGGAGGGGNFLPTVQTKSTGATTCVTIYNFSQDNAEHLDILNTTFNVTENYITPTTAGIQINGQTYELGVNATESLGTVSRTNYTVELTNLSYLPIVDTVTVTLCGAGPAQVPFVKPNSTTSNQTMPTTTVATTTVPPPSNRQPQPLAAPASNSTSSRGPLAGLSGTTLLLAIIALVIAAALVMYYLNGAGKKGGK